MQLSRCTTLAGIMLLSEVRYKDFVDNQVPQAMAEAGAALGQLSEATNFRVIFDPAQLRPGLPNLQSPPRLQVYGSMWPGSRTRRTELHPCLY